MLDRMTDGEWLALATISVKAQPPALNENVERLALKGLVARENGEWVVTPAGHEAVLQQGIDDDERGSSASRSGASFDG
jgi:hypothetical protein